MLQAEALETRESAKRQFTVLIGVWRGTQGVEAGHPRDVSFIPVAAGNHL